MKQKTNSKIWVDLNPNILVIAYRMVISQWRGEMKKENREWGRLQFK